MRTFRSRHHKTVRSELKLVEDLQAFFVSAGYSVQTEVSNMGQSADLVARRGRWITCIEAKISDWKRALIQCRAHECVADYICIAVHQSTPSERLVALATEQGYGVIHRSLDGPDKFDWAVYPRLNRKAWQPQKRKFIETFKSLSV